MAGEPLCSGTNNMLITMNTCYMALKVAAIYRTEECVASLLLDLLQIYILSVHVSKIKKILAFCDVLHDSGFTVSCCDCSGRDSVLDSTSEAVGSGSNP